MWLVASGVSNASLLFRFQLVSLKKTKCWYSDAVCFLAMWFLDVQFVRRWLQLCRTCFDMFYRCFARHWLSLVFVLCRQTDSNNSVGVYYWCNILIRVTRSAYHYWSRLSETLLPWSGVLLFSPLLTRSCVILFSTLTNFAPFSALLVTLWTRRNLLLNQTL